MRFRLALFIWGVLGLCASEALRAQELIADYYSVDDGLANRLVTDLLLDERGYVWLATENGLDRYDGYEFYHFSRANPNRDRGRLSQDKIVKLDLAADGRIMIFYEGLYSTFDLLDPETLQVEKVEISLNISRGEARAFYVDPQGVLYVLTKDERTTNIYRYESRDNQFVQSASVTESWRPGYPKVTFVVSPRDEVLIYDEEHGLRLLEGGQLMDLNRQLNSLTNKSQLERGPARFLHRSRQGEILLSLVELPGLLRFQPDFNTIQPYQGVSDSVEYGRIYEDDRGNLLLNISTFSGRYPSNEGWLCIQSNGVISNFSHLKEVGDFVISVASRDFFQDILFGLDTGLKEVRNTATKVDRILYQNLEPDERGYSMRAIVSDGEQHLYFAREVRRWYQYNKESGLLDTLILRDARGGYLNFSNCQGVLYDDRGYLWGFTSDGTDRGQGMVNRYNLETCETDSYVIRDFIQAYSHFRDGKIWLGVHRDGQPAYLMAFDTLSKTFTPFVDANGNNPFVNIHIRYLLLSRQSPDILWVGSEQGLFRVNLATREYDYYYAQEVKNTPEGTQVGLRDNTIFSLYEDEDSQLWIGTKNGLHRYDPTTESWDIYTVSDGLTSNTVACIVPDPNSNGLWVSTYNGLSYFVPDEPDEQRRFSKIDGFAHSEFNRFSCFLDTDGQLFLGGVNGISAFYPEDLLVRANVPKVLLASFSYYDGKEDTLITRLANLYDGVSLTVEPHFDYFNFNFCLPIYTPTTENQFRYRIGNAPEQEWIYLKNSRSLSYSNMKAGNYTFYVQGADPNGNWSEETLLINLRVQESFWRSPLFLSLLVIVLALISFWFYRYRLEQKLSMERLRTQLASDLHDEVSGLLAGISLQTEILRGQVADDQFGSKLRKIREASQGAMSKMSDVIWSIDARRDRLANLITRMEEHADEVLLPLGIRYQVKTYELDLQKAIPAIIRQNLYFIAKEAINNVAKHANTQRVDIRLGHEGKYFELLIKDHGCQAHLPPVIPPGRRKRKGQGIANLRMRAQRLNAELRILRGRGYTIHLRMKRFL